MSTITLFNRELEPVLEIEAEIIMQDYDRRMLGLDMPSDAYFHDEPMRLRVLARVLEFPASRTVPVGMHSVRVDDSRVHILEELTLEGREVSFEAFVVPLEDDDILTDEELDTLITDAIRVELNRIQCWDSEMADFYRRAMKNLVAKKRFALETLGDAKRQIKRAFKTIRGSEKWLNLLMDAPVNPLFRS